MGKKICFFEPNKTLGERMVEYWFSRGLSYCDIDYYSDKAKILENLTTMKADLWILDKSLQGIVETNIKAPIMWWSDDRNDADAIFKYRSADVLLSIIQKRLYDTEEIGSDEQDTKLISLYSPVKGGFQTIFGIQLAHLLSRKGRVLYLNLEGYSGFDRMMSHSFAKDISDFVYYIEHSDKEYPIIVSNFIYRLGDVDMIPPVFNPMNLHMINEAMWLRMFKALRDSHLYQYIIIDVSDFIQGAFRVLEESQYVFSITRRDHQSSCKWQQYESLLQELEYQQILEKTKQIEYSHIELPNSSDSYVMPNEIWQSMIPNFLKGSELL